MLSKVFVDANILIAGADSRSGASRAVLLMGEIGLFQLTTSRQVLVEAERNIRKKLPHALPNFVEQMTYLRLEVLPDPPAEVAAQWEDVIEAKDAPIVAAAVAANAGRLLTLNTKDFTAEVAARADIKIQTPSEFIQELRAVVQAGLDDSDKSV
jgi:predicted nucleic acid-binding protein